MNGMVFDVFLAILGLFGGGNPLRQFLSDKLLERLDSDRHRKLCVASHSGMINLIYSTNTRETIYAEYLLAR